MTKKIVIITSCFGILLHCSAAQKEIQPGILRAVEIIRQYQESVLQSKKSSAIIINPYTLPNHAYDISILNFYIDNRPLSSDPSIFNYDIIPQIINHKLKMEPADINNTFVTIKSLIMKQNQNDKQYSATPTSISALLNNHLIFKNLLRPSMHEPDKEEQKKIWMQNVKKALPEAYRTIITIMCDYLSNYYLKQIKPAITIVINGNAIKFDENTIMYQLIQNFIVKNSQHRYNTNSYPDFVKRIFTSIEIDIANLFQEQLEKQYNTAEANWFDECITILATILQKTIYENLITTNLRTRPNSPVARNTVTKICNDYSIPNPLVESWWSRMKIALKSWWESRSTAPNPQTSQGATRWIRFGNAVSNLIERVKNMVSK